MRLLAIIGMLFLNLASAWADPVDGALQAEIQGVISAQVNAFNRDDAATAYSFASPAIQQLFPSPEIFMQMVRGGL